MIKRALSLLIVFTALAFSSLAHAQLGNMSDKEAMIFKARELLVNRSFKKSSKAFSKVLKKFPGDVDALSGRAQAFFLMNEHEASIQDLETVLGQKPNDLPTMLQISMQFNSQEKFDQGMQWLEKASAVAPENEVVRNAIGYTHLMLEQSEEAKVVFEELSEADPDNMIYRMQLADALLKIEDLEQCKDVLIEILKKDSLSSFALNNLGYIYIEQEQYEKAKLVYEDWTDHVDPIFKTNYYGNYGFVRYKLGEQKKGKEMLEKALKIDSQNAYAYRYLALIALEEDDTEKACEYINKALDNDFTKSYGDEMENLKEETCE